MNGYAKKISSLLGNNAGIDEHVKNLSSFKLTTLLSEACLISWPRYEFRDSERNCQSKLHCLIFEMFSRELRPKLKQNRLMRSVRSILLLSPQRFLYHLCRNFIVVFLFKYLNVIFLTLTSTKKYFLLIEKSSRSHQDRNVGVRPSYTEKRNKQDDFIDFISFHCFVLSMTEIVDILNTFLS